MRLCDCYKYGKVKLTTKVKKRGCTGCYFKLKQEDKGLIVCVGLMKRGKLPRCGINNIIFIEQL